LHDKINPAASPTATVFIQDPLFHHSNIV